MQIQLIKGDFTPEDTLELITQLIHVKIKFHEKKVNNLFNEEDIKNREAKIIRLQKELFEAKQFIQSKRKNMQIDSTINLS